MCVHTVHRGSERPAANLATDGPWTRPKTTYSLVPIAIAERRPCLLLARRRAPPSSNQLVKVRDSRRIVLRAPQGVMVVLSCAFRFVQKAPRLHALIAAIVNSLSACRVRNEQEEEQQEEEEQQQQQQQSQHIQQCCCTKAKACNRSSGG